MKIAIHVDGRSIRGNEKQVIRIAVGLRRRGHEVVVSCRGGGPVERELARLGVRTTGIRPGGDVDLWRALRFARWLRRERVDAVLLTSWRRTWIAAWAARLAGVPRVVFRLGLTQSSGGRLGSALRWHALRSWYDALIANCQGVADFLAGTVPGLDARRIHVVLNGTELVPAEPARLREELGLGADVVLIGAVGTLEPRKGFDVLIEALALLGDEGAHGILVGAGTDAERQALDRLAAARAVGGRVHLLGHRSDVSSILAALDVFALASRAEGMAVVMLEAMAAGLPVVATDVAGTRDALEARDGRGPAGWIVPPGDPAALAAALTEVVADLGSGAAEARARGAEASWRTTNWFSVDRMVDGYASVLLAGNE